MGWIGECLDAAATLLLGAACACCGAPARGLCARCCGLLADPDPRLVGRRPGVPVWAASAYEGEWRQAIVAYKERHARHLAGPLGDALAVAVATGLCGTDAATPVVLVPMPSRPAAVRERGLDVTALLAGRAASRLTRAGLPTLVEGSLRLAGRGVDQGGLGEAERWRNVAGRLVARPRGGPATRVVVDDITTTGATLVAAVRALADAGAAPVLAAAVAATPRRDAAAHPSG